MHKGIFVIWDDHSQLNRHPDQVWQNMAALEDAGFCRIRTLGWLLKETEDFIIVAAHADDDGFTGDLTIDKRNIVKRHWIRLPK